MNANTLRRYRQYRAEGYPARSALAVARDPEPDLDLTWPGDTATFERDGFDIRVTVEYDDYPDHSWRGTFQSEWEDGAILTDDWRRIGEAYGWRGLAYPRDYTNARLDTYQWFVPAVTVAEHRAGLRDAGYSRHAADCLARQYVERDYRDAISPTEAIVTVTASRAGIELGFASVGGCGLGDDTHANRHYLTELADDLVSEAVDQAREALETLKVTA